MATTIPAIEITGTPESPLIKKILSYLPTEPTGFKGTIGSISSLSQCLKKFETELRATPPKEEKLYQECKELLEILLNLSVSEINTLRSSKILSSESRDKFFLLIFFLAFLFNDSPLHNKYKPLLKEERYNKTFLLRLGFSLVVGAVGFLGAVFFLSLGVAIVIGIAACVSAYLGAGAMTWYLINQQFTTLMGNIRQEVFEGCSPPDSSPNCKELKQWKETFKCQKERERIEYLNTKMSDACYVRERWDVPHVLRNWDVPYVLIENSWDYYTEPEFCDGPGPYDPKCTPFKTCMEDALFQKWRKKYSWLTECKNDTRYNNLWNPALYRLEFGKEKDLYDRRSKVDPQDYDKPIGLARWDFWDDGRPHVLFITKSNQELLQAAEEAVAQRDKEIKERQRFEQSKKAADEKEKEIKERQRFEKERQRFEKEREIRNRIDILRRTHPNNTTQKRTLYTENKDPNRPLEVLNLDGLFAQTQLERKKKKPISLFSPLEQKVSPPEQKDDGTSLLTTGALDPLQ